MWRASQKHTIGCQKGSLGGRLRGAVLDARGEGGVGGVGGLVGWEWKAGELRS